MTLFDLRKRIQERMDLLDNNGKIESEYDAREWITLELVKEWLNIEIAKQESRLAELEKEIQNDPHKHYRYATLCGKRDELFLVIGKKEGEE